MLAQLVRRSGLDERPEYYSGLPASIAYLDAMTLMRLHAAIVRQFGVEASKAFYRMVRDLPRLEPTRFLQTLYALEANQWQDVPVAGIVCLDGTKMQHDCTILALESGRSDQTDAIRNPYLLRYA